jgi:dihydrofolate reductase
MRKIYLFQNVSLDGYFEAPGHDLSWAVQDFEAFPSNANEQSGAMLFGHRTYDMMKAFWPTPQAAQVAPQIAKFMNERLKYVASHKPFEPGWENVTVLNGDVIAEVRNIKDQPGGNIIVFGSNTLCVSLIQAGLLDEIQVMLNPVLIGEGTPLLKGLAGKVKLTLRDAQKFKSGNILLFYEPEK